MFLIIENNFSSVFALYTKERNLIIFDDHLRQ